ncbi:adenosine deaminase [Spirosoma sp. HMF3257]|uniref:adenosine deaminase n=1 Tax=Spirosoma telluris TaxID=2183553 RepID=A0A327NR35_9BACT|nr:adenosine deaminase [Spirosoma telluris]RAI77707.1 adenosine deaminase [Spirosoma telluris]
MISRVLICLLLTINSTTVFSQNVSDYFEKIRNDNASLTAFFSQMPKGGDLHHHYSGSIYAETFINYVVQHDFVINRKTLKVSDKVIPGGDWVNFSTLENEGTLPDYKQKLIQKWSIKDYNHIDYPSDKLFFETFSNFGSVSRAELDKGLLEIKNRAIKENVSYIETLFVYPSCEKKLDDLAKFGTILRVHQAKKDTADCLHLLDSLYTLIHARGVQECAVEFNNQTLSKLHNGLTIDDAQFTMRYQSYVVRTLEPIEVFKSMIVAFESAANSPLVVGVNIAAPEDNEIALSDYWLHMVMFKLCHAKYPTVKYSLHAGELALGLVKPEELTWHINSAVHIAGANRIGHGVDIAYEANCYDLLHYMSKQKIAVEINLFSNEFILKIKDDKHPINLYKNFNVPMVICTDDAGVLRTNHTDQFVLLAQRYKQLSYNDIKNFVFNSIHYSFIEEETVRKALLTDLTRRFAKFEKSIPGIRK